MKNLTLIVHAAIEDTLADALRALPGVSSFTLTHIASHDAGYSPGLMPSTRDRVVGYTPNLRVDMILDDARVAAVLAALSAPGTGIAGRARYWVTDVTAEGML